MTSQVCICKQKVCKNIMKSMGLFTQKIIYYIPSCDEPQILKYLLYARYANKQALWTFCICILEKTSSRRISIKCKNVLFNKCASIEFII